MGGRGVGGGVGRKEPDSKEVQHQVVKEVTQTVKYTKQELQGVWVTDAKGIECFQEKMARCVQCFSEQEKDTGMSIGFSNTKVAGDPDKRTSSALEGREVVVGGSDWNGFKGAWEEGRHTCVCSYLWLFLKKVAMKGSREKWGVCERQGR